MNNEVSHGFLFSVHPILDLLLGESFNNSTYFVSILSQVNLNCIDCKSVTKIWFGNKRAIRFTGIHSVSKPG